MRAKSIILSLLVLSAFVWMAVELGDSDSSGQLILVTTTSTQDSGLLDTLVESFERETGYTVKTIAVGSGQALALGARGEADVALVHAPELEEEYVARGVFLNRRFVMYNHFILAGPVSDPAGIRGVGQAPEAFRRIADSGSPFVSRGDNSGTHLLEKRLWQLAGIEPKGEWYTEAGQGMGATLMIASEKQAYTLSDQGTFLVFQNRVGLQRLFQNDPLLRNLYHVVEVNPQRFPRVNNVAAGRFARFLLSPETQERIASFGKDRFREPLFYPASSEALEKTAHPEQEAAP